MDWGVYSTSALRHTHNTYLHKAWASTQQALVVRLREVEVKGLAGSIVSTTIHRRRGLSTLGGGGGGAVAGAGGSSSSTVHVRVVVVSHWVLGWAGRRRAGWRIAGSRRRVALPGAHAWAAALLLAIRARRACSQITLPAGSCPRRELGCRWLCRRRGGCTAPGSLSWRWHAVQWQPVQQCRLG